jgi:MOSC domain-containing protein YiiM
MNQSIPHVLTVNVGKSEPTEHSTTWVTGIHKRPVDGAIYISPPSEGKSGVAGDFIGDPDNHGGADQAVYAFQREDLDRWEQVKDREFPSGAFGENLTTIGIDVNEALVGEQWRIGDDVVLEVTGPRIPCRTFRGVIKEPRWIKEFTQDGRPGAYLRVVSPGSVLAGDTIEVIHRPPHDISVQVAFMAATTDRSLVSRLRDAAEYLPPDLVEYAATAEVDKDPEPA